ncbi:MAG: FISUMP domain-containing protein [Nanoarchaeota archaeon]|nr:FISUMP domain-containing protein [Nanoarchaeota archaeon]
MDLERILDKSRRFFRKGFVPLIASSALLVSCGDEGERGLVNSENKSIESHVKTAIGNERSQIFFTDRHTSEEVILEIVDEEDWSFVPNARATYWDGDGYEIFLVEDPSLEYGPTIGIYPHNSSHIIEMGRKGEGVYEIYQIDEDRILSKVVWSWKSENDVGFSTYGYEETIDYEDYIDIKEGYGAVVDFLWDKINESFLGVSSRVKPSEIVDMIAPEEDNPPQRWDVYAYRDGPNQSRLLTLIPSNIPFVNITGLDRSEGESRINVSWEGGDNDTYEQFVSLPDRKDLTKYLDGNSTSDLEYSYRVVRDGGAHEDSDWTEYISQKGATIDLPGSGNYVFDLRVRDEVDNVGVTSAEFSFDSPEMSNDSDLGIGGERLNEGGFEYGVIDYAGHRWLDRNLGAARRATSPDDAMSYGYLFQWGREADGHQLRTSESGKGTAPSGQQPGHGIFLTSDWEYDSSGMIVPRGPLNDWNRDTSWKDRWKNSLGNKTSADPCPKGWRVPTSSEWESVVEEGEWTKPQDIFESSLRLPFSGGRPQGDNSFAYGGDGGCYWSSDGANGQVSYCFLAHGGEFRVKPYIRRRGCSVRCVEE